MLLSGLPVPERLWTSFRPEDAELLAADPDAGRVSGQTSLVVRLWRTETLHARVARDEIRMTPAILQWRHDGAYATPIANAATSLTPSGTLATRAADLADPPCALAHLMAALEEALGEAARHRTRALMALATLRLVEADAPHAILRLRRGLHPVLETPGPSIGRRTIPLAAGKRAGPALQALWTRSDRISSLAWGCAPTSPSPPFAPLWDRGIARPNLSSAHARLALHDEARHAAEAAGVDPRHLGF